MLWLNVWCVCVVIVLVWSVEGVMLWVMSLLISLSVLGSLGVSVIWFIGSVLSRWCSSLRLGLW